jgi:hypothetical protein
MCCFITSLVLLGPRFATLVWWLINPVRFNLAFSNFILPLLGLIFLPWTTLMYLIVWSPITGVVGFDWVWLGLAVVADVVSYGGGAYGNRERIPGYQR